MGDLTPGGITHAQQIDAEFKEQAFYQPQWCADGELVVSTDKNNWWNLHRVKQQGLEPLFSINEEIGGFLGRSSAFNHD